MLQNQDPTATTNLSITLSKLIDAISRAPEGPEGLEEIYKQSLISLKSATGVERASILLFDPDGVMRFKSWLGISEIYRKRVEGHTPWGPDSYAPPPVIVEDIFQDKSLAEHYATFKEENIRALAFIPLLYRKKVIGKFMLYSKIPYDFAEEIVVASTMAQLVAYAVVRNKIERNLSLSENRLKAILENEPECVSLIDSKGIILEMNLVGLNMFQVNNMSEIIGKSIYDFIDEKYIEDFNRLVMKVCNGEKSLLEFEPKKQNQRTIILESHAAPLYSEEHGKTLLLSITRDITQKRRIEEEKEIILKKEKEARQMAEKSIALRDDFLSIASHELKTPLTPILMNFQLVKRYLKSLSKDLPTADLLLNLFENCDQQFQKYLKLVENLLDVSRINANRLVLKKESFDLSTLLRKVIHQYAPEFDRLGYLINVKAPEHLIGQWDQARIEQVISNLISNAIKYGNGNPILIELSSEKNYKGNLVAKLIVSDNGIGISKENLEKIFSRFERAASLDHYGGLGLGLFITKNIIDAHEGSISVKSEPGRGSSFKVELPIHLEK